MPCTHIYSFSGFRFRVVATATPSEMKPRFCSGLVRGNFVSVLIGFGVIIAIYPLLSKLTHFHWWMINGFVFWQGRNHKEKPSEDTVRLFAAPC